MKKIILAAFVPLIAMLGCALYFMVLKPDDAAQPPYTYEQAATLVEDENNEYYLNETASGCELYAQSKAHKSEKSLLLTEETIYCLRISDGWLYYIGSDGDICRVDVNGGNRSVLMDAKQLPNYSEYSISGLEVEDGKLFIRLCYALYSCDIETKGITTVTWDARSNFQASDGKLYFCGKDYSIGEMDIETEQIDVLFQGDEAGDLYKNFIVIDGVMHYYRRGQLTGLYSYQNGESKLIDGDAEINEYSLYEHDGKLYYVVRESDSLMQYDPAGREVKELLTCQGYSSGGMIYDGFYYYSSSDGERRAVELP